MKKVIAIAFVGMFGILTLGSCKKEWTCECQLIDYPTMKEERVIKDTKKGAEEQCENSAAQGISSCKIL